ncbi:uncharacterized protein BDZ99DRAFT_515767 [Mytilinidion resinicola]|uniref:Uncharacterized protein n=1 Tax=Mytilinidion resinicola TaxID=574789 RepID=A0A6A6Z1G9_9PEZI|nr:uncharacterized protein BDZ99DRAFT_515767 [Mytilinidion resinicola]KAF2815006.1 hypothetical protein BDZ99DRAFT_515767 [Mytilinidion resinicola]
MKLSTILIPTIFACGTLAEDFFRFAQGGMFDKRVSCGRGATCREACGGGATECGSSGNYCYDPTLGETCCGDSGYYCAAGKYCAPIDGYCCFDGETPEQCAVRQTLTFPAVSVTVFSSVEAPSAVSTSVPVAESSSIESSSIESSSVFVPLTSAPSLAPTTFTGNASFSTATLATTSPAQFTGAAVKKDSAIGAFIMGALGLLAAAV